MTRIKPSWREVNGLLLLNKPVGISSNDALQRVRRVYQAAKAGHTGNLDPLAGGLLPVCFGHATKITSHLLDADKVYEATVKLGERTNTGDAEGGVIETLPVPPLTAAQIESTLQNFIGESQQIPPMFSALKYHGQPLYRLANQGIEIERAPRRIHISSIDLLGHTADGLRLRVACSKGTYIRTLAEDIARALGTCAHLTALTRTAVPPFLLQHAHNLDDLERAPPNDYRALDQLILPIDAALMHLSALNFDSDIARALKQGQPVPHATPASGWLRLYDEQQQLFGLGEWRGGKVWLRRLFGSGQVAIAARQQHMQSVPASGS